MKRKLRAHGPVHESHRQHGRTVLYNKQRDAQVKERKKVGATGDGEGWSCGFTIQKDTRARTTTTATAVESAMRFHATDGLDDKEERKGKQDQEQNKPWKHRKENDADAWFVSCQDPVKGDETKEVHESSSVSERTHRTRSLRLRYPRPCPPSAKA